MKYLIIIIPFLISCDILSPREPESPDQGDDILFQQPNSPSIVIENLRNAFQGKNPVNFIRCFQNQDLLDEFQFRASQDVAAENPGIFTNWTLNREENVVRSVFNSLSPNISPTLILSNVESTRNNRVEQYTADYEIRIQHTLDDNIEQQYAGSLLFNIVGTEDDFWYITQWSDFGSSSSTITSTWSKMKINFDQ